MTNRLTEAQIDDAEGALRYIGGTGAGIRDQACVTAADAIAQLRADLATIRTQNAALEIDRQHAVAKMRNMERERDEARALIRAYADNHSPATIDALLDYAERVKL